MPFLSLKNISKSYATQKAVIDVSFDIEEGSIFGLLGPNGAGKSTLLRIITGIFYQDSGTIFFNNEPLIAKDHQNKIGYMPEERGLYKKMKIGEQVLYLAQLKGLSTQQATERAKYWFDRLGMETWWNKKTEDLSKGMGQKLQFVSTVIHDPQLLILDEPFSGLDPLNANLLKDEIFQLAKKGTTIIFSTHRMEQVEEICDRIILINKGEKILDGTVQDSKQQYKENLFSITTTEEIPAHSEIMDVVNKMDNTIRFIPKNGYTSNDVLKYYISKDAHIENFREILPSLNDIFIKLVSATPTARVFAG